MLESNQQHGVTLLRANVGLSVDTDILMTCWAIHLGLSAANAMVSGEGFFSIVETRFTAWRQQWFKTSCG